MASDATCHLLHMRNTARWKVRVVQSGCHLPYDALRSHVLRKLSVPLYEISQCSTAQVVWRALKMRTEGSTWSDICSLADEHVQQMCSAAQEAYHKSA